MSSASSPTRACTSGLIQWPLALVVSALFALVIGALSLRTRGVYFIMITLAFAQMIYYVGVGLSRYGGDDGLTIYRRSQFGGLINLNNKTVFYYLCFALLLVTVYCVWRLVNSRFGLVIQGTRSNDRRMRAIGFPTFRYRLACFVIAGTICGLAGVLLANHTDFISPAMMHWTRSGDLIIMAVLGGMGTVVGPGDRCRRAAGAGGDLVRLTEYWQIILGPMLLGRRAVRARRHRRHACEPAPCLNRCSRSTASPSASAASSPPTASCWQCRRASCMPSSVPTAPARPR